VFLAVIFVIPIGIIAVRQNASYHLTAERCFAQSTTNVWVTLNVIAELFGGLWFPGNATAMNYFKVRYC
jgi:hypothetical protein